MLRNCTPGDSEIGSSRLGSSTYEGHPTPFVDLQNVTEEVRRCRDSTPVRRRQTERDATRMVPGAILWLRREAAL